MFITYFLLWIIFNGSFTLEICVFGIVIAAVMFLFSCKFMDYSVAKELHNYKKLFLFVRYLVFLIKEIFKANQNVIHMILTQKEEIQPELVTFHIDVKTPAGKAFLANAITLTPGTITVSLEDSKYTVHCLDESMSEGLKGSEFEQYIKKLES